MTKREEECRGTYTIPIALSSDDGALDEKRLRALVAGQIEAPSRSGTL